jgi:hypothetical protein
LKQASYILTYEDFYTGDLPDLNEATQETVQSLQAAKAHYEQVAEKIKAAQQRAAEAVKKMKEREGKTKNPEVLKIYQARGTEESIKQTLYQTRLQAVTLASKLVDQKLLIANLRMQNQAKKKAA